MFRVIVSVSLLAGVFGQVQVQQQCPTGLYNVDLNLFQGLWYEHERVTNQYQSGECTTQDYKVESATAGTLHLSERVDNTVNTREAPFVKNVTTVDNTTQVAKLVVNIENTQTDYFIVETDNTNYAVIFACLNVNATHINAWGWKLSRNQSSILPAADAAANTFAAFNGVNWHKTRQTDCSGAVSNVASPLLALLAFFFATKHIVFSR